ncbi:MAG: nucleotidyltransferase domain-containing protein, partial [Methylophaga sp.]
MASPDLSIWDFGNAGSSVDCRVLLKTSQQNLKDRFFNDHADIDWLVHQQAHYVDEILQFLWQKHLPDDAPVSLIAVGGYGRAELHPFSDVDLLMLLDESVAEKPPESLTAFLTELWDIGLEIGHSVRSLQECRTQAEDDITIATNLLEARFLCGHEALFKDLQQLTVSNKTWDTRLFFERKHQEQIDRHRKFNETANNLEPNLKESPGGLRDIQVIAWVAQQHFGVRNLAGLNKKGFLDGEWIIFHNDS